MTLPVMDSVDEGSPVGRPRSGDDHAPAEIMRRYGPIQLRTRSKAGDNALQRARRKMHSWAEAVSAGTHSERVTIVGGVR